MKMQGYAKSSKLAAYQSAAAHGGVAASDPHRLIVMLMDGAMERIVTARGCMQRNETSEKARLINRAVSIIGELRNSLDLRSGGQIAANLAELYEYICRRLLRATTENRVEMLDEVGALLQEIRGAWLAIAPEGRGK
jgi:flagellar secretion chaperone FliS